MNKVLSVLADKPQIISVPVDTERILAFPNLTILPYRRRAFTKEQIFEVVWHEDSEACHQSVVGVINQLRKKIEPVPAYPVYVQT